VTWSANSVTSFYTNSVRVSIIGQTDRQIEKTGAAVTFQTYIRCSLWRPTGRYSQFVVVFLSAYRKTAGQ